MKLTDTGALWQWLIKNKSFKCKRSEIESDVVVSTENLKIVWFHFYVK